MSRYVKVNVERYGHMRHSMKLPVMFLYAMFNLQQYDGDDDISQWDKIAVIVKKRFADTQYASNVYMQDRKLFFTRPRIYTLEEVVAELLEILTEFVGQQTFIVVLPPSEQLNVL